MTMPLSRHTFFLLVLSCCLVANICAAESRIAPVPESLQHGGTLDLEKARKHFSQGIQFYNAGDYKLSLIEFRRSYDLSKNYRILYNIGQVNQQLGNYTNALMALEEYLRQSGADVGDDRKAEVLASILVLRTRVAHIRIVSNVDAPEVLIDGFPTDVKNTNGEIALDPGDHRIDLRKPGYQSSGTIVALAGGDANRVRIDLVRVPIATRAAAPPSSAPVHRDATWLWIGWTTTAATALGAGITGVLALTQANELATLRNSPGSTQTQRDQVGGRAKAFALSSDVLTIAALAAGATSLYLTLSSGKTEHRPAPATRVALTPGGVGIEQTF
jgi:hypothetical protein